MKKNPAKHLYRSSSFLSIGLFALFIWLAANTALAQASSTCFVEATGDDLTDFESVDETAVQQAIDATPAGGTLRLAGTCTGASGGTLATISKNLTLIGGYDESDWSLASDPVANPTLLDADGNGRVIDISSGSVTLRNLTISNGATSSFGGSGIRAFGDLTVENSVISYNQTSVVGGGIYFGGDSLLLQDSTVTHNTANSDGGGLLIDSSPSSVQIINSTVSHNQGALGGGLHTFAATLTIEQSSFYHNTATSGTGGGIYNSFSTGGLTIHNSTISQNSGGGVYHAHLAGPAVSLTVSYTTIAHNGGTGVALAAANAARNTAVFSSSLIANNGTDCTNPDGATLAVSNGYNLDSDGSCVIDGVNNNITSATPGLGTLQDNGGDSWTHELLVGSPALDQIPFGSNDCGTAVSTDQRGESRLQLGVCDIGAYEREGTVAVGCSVAALLNAVNGASVVNSYAEINLAADCVYTLTAVHTSDPDGYGAVGLPPVRGTAVVNGNGATIERDATADPFRFFYVAATGNLTLNELTLHNGYAQGGNGAAAAAQGGRGGGGAGMGGAIFNRGDLTITQSTLINHEAVGGDGGSNAGTGSSGGGGGGMGGDAVGSQGGGINGGAINQNGGVGGGGGGGGGERVGRSGGFGGGGGGGGTNAGGGNGGLGGGGGGGGRPSSPPNSSGGAGGFGGGDGGLGFISALGSGSSGGGGGGAGLGGAIFNDAGTLTIQSSTLTGNTATGGNKSGNRSTNGRGHGGAVFNNNGTVSLLYATVANNLVRSIPASNGGGLYNFGGSATLTLTSTIVADSANGKIDCINDGGAVVANSSLVESHTGCGTPTEVDPQLGTLGDYGGSTETMPLLVGSPAVDQVAMGIDGCGTTITADQRGEVRPQNGACDVGAFEGAVETAVSPTLTISNSQLTHSNNNPSCTYNLYQSSSPYSGFALSQGDIGTTPVDISGAVGGVPDYYYVAVDCGIGGTNNSNTVGEFSFAIVPGS